MSSFFLWDFLLSYQCRRYLNKVYSCFSVAREKGGGHTASQTDTPGPEGDSPQESLFGGLPLLFSSPGKWNGRTLAHPSLTYKKISVPPPPKKMKTESCDFFYKKEVGVECASAAGIYAAQSAI